MGILETRRVHYATPGQGDASEGAGAIGMFPLGGANEAATPRIHGTLRIYLVSSHREIRIAVRLAGGHLTRVARFLDVTFKIAFLFALFYGKYKCE